MSHDLAGSPECSRTDAVALRIAVPGAGDVSALLERPARARACVVLAHGAGAGMTHSFMTAFAAGLGERGLACLRYQFPFMEHGSRRPDTPAVAQATVRAAVDAAAAAVPGLRLVAGGKSFGGRMTSQAEAAAPLPGVAGLLFVGFPLHPAGRSAVSRADHLQQVALPMLFLQGTRDGLADLALISGVAGALGPRAALATFDDADHAFHVRARSGRTDAGTLAAMLDAAAEWIDGLDDRH